MTKILEMKDKLIKFYSANETYAKPVLKFLGCLMLYSVINLNIGFNKTASSAAAVLVLSLVGCLLPVGAITFLAAVVVLIHLLALSVEVALVGAILFVFILVVYYRFSSKAGMLAIVTPVLMKLNIPYIVPIGTGLIRKPYSIIPAICGAIVYYFLKLVKLSAPSLAAVETTMDGEETLKFTTVMNQFISNREMYLFIGLFVLTTIVVYLIRKSNADHAWTVAVVAGTLIQMIGFFVGYIMFDDFGDMLFMILGNIISLLLGFVIRFLFMDLDYARTERVQFEDDDYYYYVKAVPKKMVASKTVSVKTFGNTQMMSKRIEKTKSQVTDLPELDFEEIDILDEILKNK